MSRLYTHPGAAEPLQPLCRGILQQHLVRKSKAQKAAFRHTVTEALQQAGWPVHTETTGSLLPSNNLVAGDLHSARLVLTAHYDTPARLPFPNFIAPRNLFVNFLYQMALAAVLVVLMVIPGGFVLWFTDNSLLYMAVMLATICLLLGLMLAGPANKFNVNDNTSGVLTLLEVAMALPAELRGRVALVFFDNEELGLVGSSAFRKQHGTLEDKLLLNFDCVSDGDTFLFVQGKGCRRIPLVEQQLTSAFAPSAEKKVLVDSSPLTLYPSDQIWFPRGVGVVALRRLPVVGLHVSRLHTGRDRVLQAENLLFLRDGAIRLAKSLVDAK